MKEEGTLNAKGKKQGKTFSGADKTTRRNSQRQNKNARKEVMNNTVLLRDVSCV
jgi:hypothetical protein